MAGWTQESEYPENWNYGHSSMGYAPDNQQMYYPQADSGYGQPPNQMPCYGNSRGGHQNQSNMNWGYDYLGSFDEYVPPEPPKHKRRKHSSSRNNQRSSHRYEEGNYESQYGANSSYVPPEASWLEDVYSNNQADEWNNNPYTKDEWDFQQYKASTNHDYEGGDKDPGNRNENQNSDHSEEELETNTQSRRCGDPDDSTINEKHQLILKSAENKEFFTRIVKLVMYALRDTSEILSNELGSNSREFNEDVKEKNKDEEDIPPTGNADDSERFVSVSTLPNQVLLGVIRAGAAVENLLISEAPDVGETLVLVFKCKPTKKHLTRVAEILKVKMSTQLNDKISIKVKEAEEIIEIATSASKCPYLIMLRFADLVIIMGESYGYRIEFIER